MEPCSDDRRRRAVLQALAAGSLTVALPRLARAEGRPIRLGQSAPVTGPAQQWGLEYLRGLKLAFDDANARGGVAGRPVELVTYDDGYEAATARDNTAQLLADEHVFALVGHVGAESVAASLPLAVRAGVPFIAPLTGDEALRRDPPRGLVHLRAGDAAEARLIARTLSTIAFSRVAVLRQDDADGAAASRTLDEALRAAGLPAPLAVATVPRNADARPEFAQRDVVTLAAERLAATKPQAVVCLAAYATTGAVVRALRERHAYAGGCYATSLSSAAAIAPLLGPYVGGLSVTQVVPSPFDPARPVVASYREKLTASGATPEHVSLEGWIAGRVIVEALRRAAAAGGTNGPNRERFVSALETMGSLDVGGVALRWDAARREFASPVTMTVLDARGHPRT